MHVLDRAWDELKCEFDSACAEQATAARHRVTTELNQSLRRLRQYEDEKEWFSALLDGASRFAPALAIFEVKNGSLSLRKALNFDLAPDLSFAFSSAAAFASAIETKDPVIALRASSQVGEHLSAAGSNERAHLFPVVNGDRVVAILFASDAPSTDTNGLELMTGIASVVLERGSNSKVHSQINLAPAPAKMAQTTGQFNDPQIRKEENGASASRPLPPWAALDEQGQNLHVRAQRFSRVKAAEMELARPEACRAGREKGNLYLFLKNEIESARDLYRKKFMLIPSMVDYLHMELVRSLAVGDETKLGAEYPGPLI